MNNELEKIKEILLLKSSTKQLAFRNTKNAFEIFKASVQSIVAELAPPVTEADKNIEVSFIEKTPFEFHLKFSGDTLVFMMHTNVFDFENQHLISNTNYVKKNKLTEFCGLIQVYNFLSDSIKYNREADAGFLVGRFFINFENHFFLEGKKQLSYLYNDFEKQVFNQESAHKIIIEAINFALNFDLVVPNFDSMQFISLEQKNLMSFSSGMPTNKTLGFLVPTNPDLY
jgi:hypothetical protein